MNNIKHYAYSNAKNKVDSGLGSYLKSASPEYLTDTHSIFSLCALSFCNVLVNYYFSQHY